MDWWQFAFREEFHGDCNTLVAGDHFMALIKCSPARRFDRDFSLGLRTDRLTGPRREAGACRQLVNHRPPRSHYSATGHSLRTEFGSPLANVRLYGCEHSGARSGHSKGMTASNRRMLFCPEVRVSSRFSRDIKTLL